MAITVSSKKEAWEIASHTFPTDYILDEKASDAAGNPVFRSTAEDNYSWISDLGKSLELNIVSSSFRTCDRVLINIQEVDPDIEEVVRWNSDDLKNLCVKEGWYTRGNNEDYSEMLKLVEAKEPTKKNIYAIAKNILDHSADPYLEVESIMFEISKNVISRSYELRPRVDLG